MPTITVRIRSLIHYKELEKKASRESVSLSAAALELLKEGVDLGLKPIESVGKRVSVFIHVPPFDELWIREIRNSENLAGLIEASLDFRRSNVIPKPESHSTMIEKAESLLSEDMSLRIQQKQLLKSIFSAVADRKVLMLEGSTGVGKSLVKTIAAVLLSEEGRRVVIATPTIQNMNHLISTLYTLKNNVDFSVLFGRQEFICVNTLEMLLQENEFEGKELPGQEAASQWIKDGGRSASEIPGLDHFWLASGLQSVAPDFPVTEAILNTNNCKNYPNDPAVIEYERHKEHSKSSVIVFKTHAMLCIEHLQYLKQGAELDTELVDPSKDVVLIDEAHSFEQQMVSARTMLVSLNNLRITARSLSENNQIAVKYLPKVMQSYKKLHNYNSESLDIVYQSKVSQDSELKKLLNTYYLHLRKFKDLLPKTELKNNAKFRYFIEVIEDFNVALNDTNSVFNDATIDWSSSYSHPRFLIGPKYVGNDLKAFWFRYRSVILLSGTLYLPGVIGHRYYQRELFIPDDKLMITNPVIAPWLREGVTLHLPERGHGNWLTPPKHSGTVNELEENTAQWNQELIVQLIRITRNALGGTVVLCTSYVTIQGLSELFLNRDFDQARLVIQTREKAFNALLDEYRSKYKHGKRPILLSVGRAWTGMDLSDTSVKAEDDHLISDLVIPRLPFGTNRSSTHNRRIQHNFTAEVCHAGVMFQQGIGRLVRREGVRRKNLWILDARIMSAKERKITFVIRGVAKEFKNKVFFKP